MSPALEAHGLELRIGGRALLSDVSLRVEAGEVVALVGPNGAGKSTLLATLAGDLSPARGTVQVNGRDLTTWRLRELARERAVLTQEQRVAFGFAVREVVTMGRAPWHGRPESDHDEVAVADALDRTATTALADQAFGTLSGGERARTAFARTLAQEAGVWLLDEPTAALDLGHQEALLGRVREAAVAGAAVVVVLHDLSLAAAWADRIVLLADGSVAADGPPPAVLTAERLGSVYDHPVEVLPHPVTGALLVLPRRTTTPTRAVGAPDALEEHPA